MSIIKIVVGMDGWYKFTLPAIQSMREHDPDIPIMVMDCGKHPYPHSNKHAEIIRLDGSPSYAYAMNTGAFAAGKHDWLLFLNNDVLQEAPLQPVINELTPDKIYGRQILMESGHVWLGLWIALLPWEIWTTVGEWDERFLLCGFEDADYCVRAFDLGYSTAHAPLPFYHFEGVTRWGLDNYSQVRFDNMEKFKKKHGFPLGESISVLKT